MANKKTIPEIMETTLYCFPTKRLKDMVTLHPTFEFSCPYCGVISSTVHEVTFKNGFKHIELYCEGCRRSTSYLPRKVLTASKGYKIVPKETGKAIKQKFKDMVIKN